MGPLWCLIPNTSKPVFGSYPDIRQAAPYVIVDPKCGRIIKFGITHDPPVEARWRTSIIGIACTEGSYQIRSSEASTLGMMPVERYVSERIGGPEDHEPRAGAIPSNLPWHEELKNAIHLW